MADSSKTEKATPKKRRDERKKGNTFMSQDAVSIATLLTSAVMFFALSGVIVSQIGAFLTYCFEKTSSVSSPDGVIREISMQAIGVLAKTVLPIAALTGLAAIVATFLQTRLMVSGDLIKPKFNRISPLQGAKRLFSLRSVVNALKGILKITILLVIIYLSLRSMFLESSRYLYTDLPAACSHLFSNSRSLVFKVVLAFVAVAALDALYQWWEFERQMKMSKQEVKEEYKQIEGDPKIKAKIKENQRKMSQRRMMQQVPMADVIIRNPTHFAVALRYKPETDSAPVVLAKGQDDVALRIVKIAEEHKIAVIENVPLARALYANTELDSVIPPEFYGAVAEILVYIFRLSGKTGIA